ncbi:MAG TPA: YdcF family protein [Stellaceae bacterium]|jgi:uncharacterized SAM-binding protein YcdF (DUF218 family)|nr:YdcF family protein [Stellaceae bacterium]
MFDLVSYGALAPPEVLILFAVLGGFLALVSRRLGLTIVLAASLSLYALATPAVSSSLMRAAEAGVPETLDFTAARAIVVLGADLRLGAAGAPDTLGPFTTERVVYAAQAYRKLQVPIAVSGGPGEGSRSTAGDLMRTVLNQDFGIPVAWDEDRSTTTWENALDTKPLLDSAGITTIVLVTHAWHMRRAVWCFERLGLHAFPWPAPRTALRAGRMRDFLPRPGSLQNSFFALHELVGGVYYRVRH